MPHGLYAASSYSVWTVISASGSVPRAAPAAPMPAAPPPMTTIFLATRASFAGVSPASGVQHGERDVNYPVHPRRGASRGSGTAHMWVTLVSQVHVGASLRASPKG